MLEVPDEPIPSPPMAVEAPKKPESQNSQKQNTPKKSLFIQPKPVTNSNAAGRQSVTRPAVPQSNKSRQATRILTTESSVAKKQSGSRAARAASKPHPFSVTNKRAPSLKFNQSVSSSHNNSTTTPKSTMSRNKPSTSKNSKVTPQNFLSSQEVKLNNFSSNTDKTKAGQTGKYRASSSIKGVFQRTQAQQKPAQSRNNVVLSASQNHSQPQTNTQAQQSRNAKALLSQSLNATTA